MTGKFSGFGTRISHIVENSIVQVSCSSHKLALSIRNAVKNDLSIKTFEKIVNALYNFYYHASYKRKSHLKAMAEEMSESFYELSQIIQNRWFDSHKRTVNKTKYIAIGNCLSRTLKHYPKIWGILLIQETEQHSYIQYYREETS